MTNGSHLAWQQSAATVVLLMLGVAVLACAAPALRAARLDPLVILKRS